MSRKKYSPSKKAKIVKAVEDFDKEHGRGRMASPHKKYKASYLTLRR